MRVVIVHPDSRLADQTQQVVHQIWHRTLTDAIQIPAEHRQVLDYFSQIALPWPDLVMVSLALLERHPDILAAIQRHPGYGFFRLVVLVRGSDQHGRAALLGSDHEIVHEPVSPMSLRQGMAFSLPHGLAAV